MLYVKATLLCAICFLVACAAPRQQFSATRADAVSCDDRATQIISANVTSITTHHYDQASRMTERAGRLSLACAAAGSQADRFGARWRASNALVVAAELAHEAHDYKRAHSLLHEGYAIMHALHPPRHVSELTSTLIAQKLDSARHDMAGQWAYW